MKATHILPAVLAAMVLVGASASSRASTVYTESFEGTISGTLHGDVVVEAPPNYFGQATDGTHFLAFNPNAGDAAYPTAPIRSFTSTDINTLNGGSYTLTFDYGMWSNGGSQQLAVTVADTVTNLDLGGTPTTETNLDGTGTVVGAGTGFGLDNPIYHRTLTFTGTGNPITLSFVDVTTSGIAVTDGLFDNIVLTGPLAPEPASLGLLGVGGLLLTMRRRRR